MQERAATSATIVACCCCLFVCMFIPAVNWDALGRQHCHLSFLAWMSEVEDAITNLYGMVWCYVGGCM